MEQGFAIWITGLPASGKSTVTRTLVALLKKRGVDAAVLESDVLRKTFTPKPRYDEEERQVFYGSMVYVGALLTGHGVPVIFDATANRRAYRDAAREKISQFLEVYVDSPLALCMARDPKGIYKQGEKGASQTVPGLQTSYEPPEHPDVVIQGDHETPETAAQKIISHLLQFKYISSEK